MNKSKFLYIILYLTIVCGTCLSIITLNALTYSGYIVNGYFTETKLGVLLIVSLFVSMLAFSAILFIIKKHRTAKK